MHGNVNGRRSYFDDVPAVAAVHEAVSVTHPSANLDGLDVVHAGTERYQLAPSVRALPAAKLADSLDPLPGS